MPLKPLFNGPSAPLNLHFFNTIRLFWALARIVCGRGCGWGSLVAQRDSLRSALQNFRRRQKVPERSNAARTSKSSRAAKGPSPYPLPHATRERAWKKRERKERVAARVGEKKESGRREEQRINQPGD